MNKLTCTREWDLVEDARYDILHGLNELTDKNNPCPGAIKDLAKAFHVLSERSDWLRKHRPSADEEVVDVMAFDDECADAFDDLKLRVMRYLESREAWRKTQNEKSKAAAMAHLQQILPGCVALFEVLRKRTAQDGCKEEKTIFAEWAARLS